MRTDSPKVVFVYYALLHYRQSLFDFLSESEKIKFHIICGKKSQFPDSKYYNSNKPNVTYVKNRFFKFLGSLFYIQTPVIKAVKSLDPHKVVLRGVNPQIVSMLYLFLWLKVFKPQTKIYWWGHGTLGNQGGFGRRFRKFFYKRSDGVLLQGNKGIALLKGINIPEDKIHVVGNNMNDDSLGYKTQKIENKQADQKISLIYVGRLVEQKRVDLLLEACLRLKENKHLFSCCIIGEGPISTDLKEYVTHHGLSEEINFTGALYEEALTPYFLHADLLIMPDYAGLSLIHGLSFGLPFITSDDFNFHGPEIEVLQREINGSVYKKDNVEDLVDKILFWHNKMKRKNNIADDCIASIHDYSTEFVGNNFINVLAN